MSPTYTMSAHLCKQIYSSWIQSRNVDQLPSPPTSAQPIPNLRRSPSPDNTKRPSMEDGGGRRDSSSSLGSSPSSGWTWQRR